MPKVITLNNIKITAWRVDVPNRRVDVYYQVMEGTGEVFEAGVAVFWETIPPEQDDGEGNPVPRPDNWYQLPAKYNQLLTDLTVDSRSALLHLINE